MEVTGAVVHVATMPAATGTTIGAESAVAAPGSEQGLANTPKRRASWTNSKPGKGDTSNKKKKRSGSNDMHCKTCSYCRLKKIKCDSTRPSCRACETNNIDCVYPQDTRRLNRPSQGRIDALEQQISGIMKHISSGQLDKLQGAIDQENNDMALSKSSPQSNFASSGGGNTRDLTVNTTTVVPIARSDSISFTTPGSMTSMFMQPEKPNNHGVSSTPQTSLSPREAQIAGIDVSKDGDISVHGPSSMMHQHQQPHHQHNTSLQQAGRGDLDEPPGSTDESFSLHAAKARLVSYAAIQRQSESFTYRTLGPYMDFDGVEPELAAAPPLTAKFVLEGRTTGTGAVGEETPTMGVEPDATLTGGEPEPTTPGNAPLAAIFG